MSNQILRRSVLIVAVAALCLAGHRVTRAADGPYKLVDNIRLGFPAAARDFDETNGRMYVSAKTGVYAIDTASKKVLGRVGSLQGGGSLAIAPERGELFVVAQHEDLLTVLDVTTGNVLRRFRAPSSYSVFYERGRQELYLLREMRKELLVMNAVSGSVVTSIALGGEPSFLEGEPETGRVFVRLANKDVMQVIDTKEHAIVASWPMKSAAPSWIAVDTPGRRLFVASGRSVKMIDSQTGKELDSLGVADEVRSVVFDPGTQLMMASWGGRVTVARATATTLTREQTIEHAAVTSLYLDPKTHSVFGSGYDRGARAGEFVDGSMFLDSALVMVFKLAQ
jgi:DNA-binding beta-propeller fold protein YncE